MEIILKKDYTGLGLKNDLLSVKDGYGRNFLIPQGIAIIATSSKKKELAELNKQQAFRLEKIRKEAEIIAQALEGSEIQIAVKAGANNNIFGSVTNVMVANAIKDQKSLEVDRKRIQLPTEVIKELGKYEATISLYKDVAPTVILNVIGE